jgi:hypothetical protein
MNPGTSKSLDHMELSGSNRKSSVSSKPPSFCRSPGPLLRTRSQSRSDSRVQRQCTFPGLSHSHHDSNGGQRRCTSEPEVGQIIARAGTGTGPANARFPSDEGCRHQHSEKKNSSLMTKLHIAQRSTSSKVVKKILSELQDSCDILSKGSPCSSRPPPPESECAMLAQLAVDAYYRVVIAKNKGISTICSAMKSYPENASIQASCCAALHYLLAESFKDDAVNEAGWRLLVGGRGSKKPL